MQNCIHDNVKWGNYNIFIITLQYTNMYYAIYSLKYLHLNIAFIKNNLSFQKTPTFLRLLCISKIFYKNIKRKFSGKVRKDG